ncbi:recombinase family protein [Vibrio parahaemolyticus]|uniref:recombinase family protein n=1 Tax=Vibrio parahaemolyticus TaxID=670 RepID=UPI0008132E2F|nr:recombinase family protein [Vibrio parahaemolyticus]OCP62937.1 hypothetical protein AKH04_04855 [Vibrio parahaemolyticus]
MNSVQRILVYLRASTKEQDATRAKDAIDAFLEQRGKAADGYYVENVSGTKLDRPELIKLLADAKKGDILIVEQVDRLTRLTAEDWKILKRTIEDTGIHLVSLDLPTSHLVLNDLGASLVGDILVHVNNLLLEILATTARKDYEDRKRRQAEGIKVAQEQGRWKGKQASPKTLAKCQLVDQKMAENGLTASEAIKLVGVARATYYKYIKDKTQVKEVGTK